MLFLDALLYTVIHPDGDDGECGGYDTQQACIEPRSDYNSAVDKCAWQRYSDGTNDCLYQAPSIDADTMIVVFVLSFLLGECLRL